MEDETRAIGCWCLSFCLSIYLLKKGRGKARLVQAPFLLSHSLPVVLDLIFTIALYFLSCNGLVTFKNNPPCTMYVMYVAHSSINITFFFFVFCFLFFFFFLFGNFLVRLVGSLVAVSLFVVVRLCPLC